MSFNPITIIITLLILTFIVAIHEFGHFAAAKIFKMDVKEFSIGFGKIIFQKFYRGTNYSIRLIPLGGFVELEGEHSSENPNSFRNHPYHEKLVVMVAGVFMNLVLAVVLLSGYLAATGYKFPITKLTNYDFSSVDSQAVYSPITIVDVAEASPVKGLLSAGDIIVKANGIAFAKYEEFFSILENNQGKSIPITLVNIDTFETQEIRVEVPFKAENGSILQVSLNSSDQPAYFLKYKPTVISGFAMTYDIFVYQIKALGGIFRNAFSSGNYNEVAKSVGGIVQVAGTVNSIVNISDYSFLVALTAFISISLAFFNILPIPALDGGQVLIITIEKFIKRKLSDKTVGIITTIGFSLLILLAVIVTFKDVIQLVAEN